MNGRSKIYTIVKPDYIQCAAENLQLCSYFSIFIAIPSPKDSCGDFDEESSWSREQVFDVGFVQNMVHELVPRGIGTLVKANRVHFELSDIARLHGSQNLVKQTAVEFKVFCFGEKIPITVRVAETIKERIEVEVSKMSPKTRKGAWNVSHVIPRKLVSI